MSHAGFNTIVAGIGGRGHRHPPDGLSERPRGRKVREGGPEGWRATAGADQLTPQEHGLELVPDYLMYAHWAAEVAVRRINQQRAQERSRPPGTSGGRASGSTDWRTDRWYASVDDEYLNVQKQPATGAYFTQGDAWAGYAATSAAAFSPRTSRSTSS